MAIVLGENQYGKAEVRLVHIDKSGPAHVIKDVNVTSQLRGDFAETHHSGDNSRVIATDTQKNTVYALARSGGITTIEEFALRMARTFVDNYEYVRGARQEIEEYGWNRIDTTSGPHDTAFVRGGTEIRNTVVTKDGDKEIVISGLTDLVVLKSAGSEFWGYPKVPFTGMAETKDRIMATACSARWRYLDTDLDWDAQFASVRAVLLEAFAASYSYSLQQTLFEMGKAVLQTHVGIAEIRLSMPNKHHFAVDLEPFGLDNPNQVFYAADRPYGLIEASVLRDDAPAAGNVWSGIAGFV